MTVPDPDNDPFGLADSERTQLIRPVPGGRAGAGPAATAWASAPPPSSPQRRVGSVAGIVGTPGRGPLVESAFGLLSLAPLLRARTPPADPDQLRAQIESDLRAFSERALAKGLDQRLVALGHYALCALLDDLVLNTPWGAHGAWRANTLAGALHHDAAGGEHFFAYLDQAKAQPERSRPVLELMAGCLALGFEGRFRLAPQGQAALERIRSDLFATLQRLDGPQEDALSPHWQGVAASHVPIARRVPSGVFATAAAAVLVLIYVALSVRLGASGERLDAAVATLPPGGAVGIVRQTAAGAPLSAPIPRAAALEPRLRTCLPEPARSQPDAVTENLQGLRIRLPNAGLFASGTADLEPRVRPVIACLASTLKAAGGKVAVIGHTDNAPIHTARFPSNWELSRARAEAVAAVARPILGANRLQVAGRSDSEPVASNSTDDGRARNRRVEIVALP